MADDFYQILDVPRTASDADITKAYRKLARKYHPDLTDEDDKDVNKKKFQKVQQAYDVLSDPKKRQMYDQLGPNYDRYASAGGGQASGGNPFGAGGQMDIDLGDLFGGGGFGGNGGGVGLDEILRQFGGGGFGFPPGGQPGPGHQGPGHHGQQPAKKNFDIEQSVTVPFDTAISGGQHSISLQRGEKVEELRFKVPAGIESGKKIRLRGQGRPNHSGPKGDLLIKIHVAPHPTFQRQGSNLHCKLPISVAEAAFGAKVDLPTPHGTIALSVPAGSQSGQSLRLKGMGVRAEGKPAGDLIAELQIMLPHELSEAQHQALKQFASTIDGFNPRKIDPEA